jgi:outer membrane protein assembly factor BamD
MPRSVSNLSPATGLTRVLAAVLLSSALLSGCGLLGDKLDPQKSWTVEQFYRAAREEMDAGNNLGAIKLYEQLEAKYPFGKYAQQAQLDVAYANYREGETAAAISAADRFIKLHPNHPAVDYAIYLKGLAHYKLDMGFLGTWLTQDMSERDPKALRESFDSFKELVERFPESKYAEDSQARMVYLVNTLAKHEVQVAQYYYNRGAYLAAANRAQATLTRYPQAPANQEALVMMVRAYEKLEMKQLADDARRVLQKNFPENATANAAPGNKAWWKLW